MADGSIIIDTKLDSSALESGISKLSSLGKVGLGAITAGVAAATGAVVALTKASVEQYAQYEQMTGGVETLFKDSSDIVMNYANNAYKTAGLSANEYMNTITGFSASLLQGLGGDTQKAAEVGNKAVVDMSDNANKMGTSMESIQNAYQGFAKQNYTMLDNLKLGYGGTKEEMQRLLSDAEKLTGIHYDISNFSDVIEAIHVIQENMDITGTTAKEAATTIEGSLNMTKSAWTNMLTGMADDNADFDTLVNNLVESVSTLGENLMPRIGIALEGVGMLIESLLPVILNKIPDMLSSAMPGVLDAATNILSSLGGAVLESLPTLIDLGIQVIASLLTGIQENMPQIASSATEIVSSLVNGILQILPMLLDAGLQTIGYFAEGISEQLPELIPAAMECVTQLVQGIVDNAPLILDAAVQLLEGLAQGLIDSIPVVIDALPEIIQGILDFFSGGVSDLLSVGSEIILQLVDGITQAIPDIIAVLPQIIQSLIDYFTSNIPQIAQNGIQVITSLIQGLIQAIPTLIGYLPQIIVAIVTGIVSNLPQIIMAGLQIIVALAQGLIQAIPQIVAAVPSIISALVSAFGSMVGQFISIGGNIIAGIGNGIINGVKGLVGSAVSACKELVDGVKNFFGIHSPSRLMRDMIGKNIVLGIAVGIQRNTSSVENACTNMANSLKGSMLDNLTTDDMEKIGKQTADAYIKGLSNGLNDNKFNYIGEAIENAQEKLDKANEDKIDNDYWYAYYKNWSDDLQKQIKEINKQKSKLKTDSTDKQVKQNIEAQKKELEAQVDTLQEEKEAIDENVDYYKKKAQERIAATKEEAKAELQIAKDTQSRFNDIIKAITTAIKNKLTEEKKLTLDNISEEEDALEERYNKEIDRIKSKYNKKIEYLQKEKDALDKQKESEDRNVKISDYNNQLNVLQTKMANATSVNEKKAYELQIADLQKEMQQQQHEWSISDQKAQLDEEISLLKEKEDARLDDAKKDYENEKSRLAKKKKAQEEYYDEMLEQENINAQARYMILQGNFNDILTLLQSYNPNWQNAGQSLADSLINGLNSKKQDMRTAISEFVSMTNTSGTLDGYASGTSYNKVSGLYNVDENDFELSTGNAPVAYVSKGAGILNHMQSLAAIKKEVANQLSDVRDSMIAEQNRFVGQLVNNATNNTTRYGDVNLNIEHFHNDKNDSIEKLNKELGWFASTHK